MVKKQISKGIEIKNISDKRMRLAFGRIVDYLEPDETKEYQAKINKDQDSFINVARIVIANHLSSHLTLKELVDPPKQKEVA